MSSVYANYSREDLIREIIEETGYVRLLQEEDTEQVIEILADTIGRIADHS